MSRHNNRLSTIQHQLIPFHTDRTLGKQPLDKQTIKPKRGTKRNTCNGAALYANGPKTGVNGSVIILGEKKKNKELVSCWHGEAASICSAWLGQQIIDRAKTRSMGRNGHSPGPSLPTGCPQRTG